MLLFKRQRRVGTHGDSQSSYRFISFALSASLALLIFLVPSLAYAAEGIFSSLTRSVISFSTDTIVQSLIALLQVVQSGIAWASIQVMSGIELVLGWQAISNNVVIQSTWEIARDLCNMLFIVGLVIISFATIFRALNIGPLQKFYWRTALPKLLVAAILINLSLGMSQAVVLISNKVTTTLTGVIRGTFASFAITMDATDIATSMFTVTDAQVASRNLGNIVGSLSPENTDWEHYLATQANREPEEEEAYQKCLNEEVEVGVLRGVWNSVRGTSAPRKSIGACVHELAMKRRGERPVSFAERVGVEAAAQTKSVAAKAAAQIKSVAAKSDAEQSVSLLASAFMQVIFSTMIVIALGSAFVFFVLRVIALWVLMAFSAFAFGFMWLTDGESLKKWWTQFLGWNVFGPYYLLVLIFGMAFLVRAGDLTASLDAVGTPAGLPGALLGTFLKYVMALIVFVGGLGLALNSSFATAVKSTPVIGGVASRLGAFSAVTASQAFGRRVAQGTGVPAGFQATKERLVQEYRARRPEALRMKSDDERLAAARSRLGVFGGAQAEQQELAKRVTTAQSGLKDRLATVPKGDQESWLRGQMNKGDRATKLAARQVLLERGKLTESQIRDTKDLYPKGLAQTEFDKSIDKASANDPNSIMKYRIDEFEKKRTTDEKYKSMSDAEWNAELEDKKDDLLVKHYSAALNNAEAFGKLDKKYFEPGNAEFESMKKTIDARFPKGNQRARASAFQRLSQSIDDRKKNKALKEWFGSDEAPPSTESPKPPVG